MTPMPDRDAPDHSHEHTHFPMDIFTHEHEHQHRTVPAPATCNLKVEKNSRGMNYECTVVGAASPEEADRLMRDLRARAEAIVNGEDEVPHE